MVPGLRRVHYVCKKLKLSGLPTWPTISKVTLLLILFVSCMQSTLSEKTLKESATAHRCSWKTPSYVMCVQRPGSHRHCVYVSESPPHLACASSHKLGALGLRSRRCKPSRAARAENRSIRQPRAPVSPLEVPTLHATIPAKMITMIMQAERLAAGHRQGSL
jgi:hypothetical protein